MHANQHLVQVAMTGLVGAGAVWAISLFPEMEARSKNMLRFALTVATIWFMARTAGAV